ncbi:phosphopantetheinyl transferase (holo-ACP synthase) [Pedobacter cryoconitis]|uniref:Phosphopantetheinyl transferase (Holo-ACP synthase) n=1 Tax=Pedobacter cryoconitis TaxID=188932 RepID=A0A7W8ZIS5_9SPHI|nr:4'-phosphopantetheinyl transferase superfamily protein [Pedobacter cryoconitis]MBB5634713.1 phosphopantetheinyl transferase (holo-ACP synthase) [Pedobacter cryoconitis]MBB6272156.1 phosphopantetheinyl transferase (holo-ACP synthase) [Pedobacter cryoconitis]
MIGNDIVDLRKAALESNWQRKGYLTKICTFNEQQLILEAPSPVVMLWLIWTMKEAACKIVQRKTGIRSYVPLSFNCETVQTDSSAAFGKINYLGEVFQIRSEIKKTFIHSIAVSAPEDFEHLQLHYLPRSAAYKEEFNNLSKFYLLAGTPSGLPELTHQLTGQKHAVSISHHGDYLAVVYSDSLLLTD